MTSRHLGISLALALAVLAGLGGCGSRQAVPADPSQVPGYLQAPPALAGVDPTPLRGRRILLDPGHGGFFRGAVGDGGLTEAEVNLGVALYLQGMLQWAGAEVTLTRTTDTDFLSPADSSLSADLAARVALADSLRPDVFVSIHHNSTASRDPDINETQTYYPLGREDADLDLARAIHRQLVRLLEIEPAKILPGGFHVLRESPVPAVLGEPAMISNPVIEGRLSLARSLELEASAYFLGLRDYFAAGTPRWVTDLPDTIRIRPGPATPHPTWSFEAGGPTAPGLDPATIRVTLDGTPVNHHLSADGQSFSLRWPELAEDGIVAVQGRNLGGRAAPTRRHLLAPTGAERWSCAFWYEPPPPPYRGLLSYGTTGTVLSELAPLVFARPGEPDDAIPLPTRSGDRGWLFLDPGPDDLLERQIARVLPGGELSFIDMTRPVVLGPMPGTVLLGLDAPESHWPSDFVPGGRWRSRLPQDTVLLQNNWSGRPAVIREPAEPLWLEADGAITLFSPGEPEFPPGGVAPPARRAPLVWQPILPALIGKRVALDPRGGGTEAQGTGPLGTRGSELNLHVAERLAALLRGAGCEVELLREGELYLPDPERVLRADRFGAELYLAIGRGAPTVRHHHGSQVGEPWAEACAASLTPLLPDTVAAEPAYDYILRHTACPAVLVRLEEPTEAAVENRLADPAWQDAVARALFRATATTLQPGAPFARMPELLAPLGERAIGRDRLDLVRLDGNLSWLPPSGQVTGVALPSWSAADPGLPVLGDRHLIELRDGPHWQLWSLERLAEGEWDGRLLLENR